MPDSQTTQQEEAVAAISTSSKTQCTVGLQLQAYCQSVLEQPKVSFAGFDNLAAYEAQINAGLAAAQTRADNYLNKIRPAVIENVTNISNYFALHSAVADTLPEGSSKKDWLDSLGAVKDTADEYRQHAADIVTMLSTLNGGLTTDVASFNQTVNELNTTVNGDNGVLASLDSEIDDIQSKIGGAIAGVVLSGLAIVGGSIMILVGALAEPFTAGASTALVVGGAAILIAGIGGEVGAGVALGGLLDQKGKLISRKSTLNAEVQFALGMKTGFADLRDQAGVAVQAATAMQNAWEFLGGDLGNLSNDLNKGIIGTDAVRKLWLATANKAIKTVGDDVSTIKYQMAGTSLTTPPAGTTIGTYVAQVAHELAA
jgi:hypothetical protein